MAYVAPVHRATSPRHALRMHLKSPDEENLIIAKANRIEVWRYTEDGLLCADTRVIYGTIVMLQRLQPKDAPELLFVGTDRQQYFTVLWNHQTRRLDTVKENGLVDDSEPYMRHSLSQNQCLVDPTGRFMVMHLWEGVLNPFRLRTRAPEKLKLDMQEQVRLTELWIKDSIFVHTPDGHPTIAFLYNSRLHQEEAQLAVYRLTKDDAGNNISKFDPTKDRTFQATIEDHYARTLIPVRIPDEKRYQSRQKADAKPLLGGLLVVGETLLTYFDSTYYNKISVGLREPKLYVAWEQYDDRTFILADDYGRLDVLTLDTMIEQAGEVVQGMTVTRLQLYSDDGGAEPSRASQLVYLGDNKLFLASRHGDCQVLLLDLSLKRIQIIDTIRNNAPILDFAIMDMGNREGNNLAGNAFSSGQARVVAGCGAYKDGSLRSIRSGVGLADTGMLDEIEGTRGLHTLRLHGAAPHSVVLVSLLNETRVFRFSDDGEGIEEVFEFGGFALDAETLLATSLPSGLFLQATPDFARLTDGESGMTVAQWDTPNGQAITAASANDHWLLMSIEGTVLVSLDLTKNLAAKQKDTSQNASVGIAEQMSCLHASSCLTDIGVVGWWTSGTISLVRLDTLESIRGESLRQTSDSAAVPRDVALVQLHQPDLSGPTLLVATEDGNIISFAVGANGSELSGRKTVTLGSRAARLHILPQDSGVSNVFATTDHPSLIYSSDGRLVYSATTADDATFVAPFDPAAFPDHIILSTDRHVRLSRIDTQRLTHVKPLTVSQTVRRLAYSPGLKAFGLGCIKKTLENNTEIVSSSFQLVDEVVFKKLGDPFELQEAQDGLEMVECLIRAELPDANGTPAERFIIGTSVLTDGDDVEGDGTRGRIIVIGVDENRKPYQLVSLRLKGNCRCLGVLDGYLIAGLSKTLVAFSYQERTSATAFLEKIAAYRPSSMPIDLDISGNMIGVGDLRQSLTLVEFQPPTNESKAKLIERARDYQPSQTTAVCQLGGDKWLEADALGNLLVLRRNAEAPTEQDQKRLEITSEMNLGEQINRIRSLQVAPTENTLVQAKAFLGSVEGSMWLFGEVQPGSEKLLMDFQDRLVQHVDTPGELNFDGWRAYRGEHRTGEKPYRFLDGEILERFLDLNESQQEVICEGLGPSAEEMRNYVEELRLLH